MSSSSSYRRKSHWRRKTWPRVENERLETIPESPRTPKLCRFSTDQQWQEKTPQAGETIALLDGKAFIQNEEKTVSPDMMRAQMIWFSHHLEQSHRHRDGLNAKIEELESVCKSQAKVNTTLLRDVISWQSSYEQIESEMIDAMQEIEEARDYVRSIETANANLRYALAQAREEQAWAHRRQVREVVARCWRKCTHLPTSASGATLRLNTARDKCKPTRPQSTSSDETILRRSDSASSKGSFFGSNVRFRLSVCTIRERSCAPRPDEGARHGQSAE